MTSPNAWQRNFGLGSACAAWRRLGSAQGIARAVVCAGLLGASACTPATFIVQQYDGEPRQKTEVAILRINGSEPLRLEELDGEVLAYELHDRGARVHIEMLPGEHEIGLADGAGLPLKRRRFVAAPGMVYRPMVFHTDNQTSEDLPKGAWVVAIYEVDADSDAVVREISQVQKPQ